MKHLVLGSAGQIGYHLVNYLKEAGHEVSTFDIVDSENQDLRIQNNSLLYERVSECDIVHFLAFDIGGSLYMKKYQDTYSFISNNVKIMNNVFDVLQMYNKPFIFASSQMSNMSYSTYGMLKAIGEKYTQSLNGVIAKFWNVYGYEKDPEKFHVVTDFIKMAKNDGVIRMKTDGTESRQFLYADDCSMCLMTLSENYDSIDRSKQLHVTSFEWNTIMSVAKIITSRFGKTLIISSDQKDEVQQNKKNQPDEYIFNYWRPQVSLEDGINKIITEHYK